MGLGFCAAGGISKLNFDAGFGTFMIMIGVVLAFTGLGQLLSWRLRRPAPPSGPQ
jgi:predicted phage tail protein